jgi:transcription initiation factor TFIIIB Brf1 subunit/transcription initiation factor TFIIB
VIDSGMAPSKAAVIAIRLDCSPTVRERARRFAAAADLRHDIQRSPTVLGAAAVYTAALLENEKVTQPEVVEAAGVSEAALRDAWHDIRDAEFGDTETVELYRCTECGKLSVSLGYLHGHAEKHRGWGPFGLLPAISGDADALMEYTEVLEAEITNVKPGGEPA